MASQDDLKRDAAREAVKRVKSGMRVGLGTGSTSKHAVIAIGELLASGALKDIVGMPTSDATEQLAKAYNIPLAKLTKLDIAIDGADEVDPQANLIKGGGGAMLRERAVEVLADKFIVIADESKLSLKLGTKFALPVEMPAEAASAEAEYIASLGGQPQRRGGDKPFLTDNGHVILDVKFPNGIDDAYALAKALEQRPSIKAHGLFLDMTTTLIIAAASGMQVREIK